MRRADLLNHRHDRVKMVYHPDFVSPSSPLLGMEYGQFVRGCHMGVFPSYYEPWGYTPLECVARGVPAITSDLSGFGDYVLQTIPDPESKGIFVVHRQEKSFDESAEELAEMLWQFVQLNRRERIMQRNAVESSAELFDWKNLRVHYDRAYATDVEGYPGLVVHGPLTAVLLLQLVRQHTQRPVVGFSFRGVAPLFDLGPVRLVATAGPEGVALEAQGPDGRAALLATATLA